MSELNQSFTPSKSLQYVRLHPILMSILLYHYKELTDRIEQVKGIETRVKKRLASDEYEKEVPTLDSYFVNRIAESR